VVVVVLSPVVTVVYLFARLLYYFVFFLFALSVLKMNANEFDSVNVDEPAAQNAAQNESEELLCSPVKRNPNGRVRIFN